MKKLFITVFALIAFAINTQAQTTSTDAAKPELTKEEKAKLKAAKEADENEAFKIAGLTEEEITKVKEINKEINQKSKDLKDSSLTDEEKEAKKKELNEEKKTKVKAVMGDARFKTWGEARKQIAARPH